MVAEMLLFSLLIAAGDEELPPGEEPATRIEISVSDTELLLRRKYLSEDTRLSASRHCNRLYPETMIMLA